MLSKLEDIYKRWKDIETQMNAPETISNMKLFIKLNKDYKDLQPIIDAYLEYSNILQNLESTKEILQKEKDDEFRQMAKEELTDLNQRKIIIEEDIRLMLIPADPQDGKNAVMEIRAGTGGDEASIFAGDLFRLYSKYCENKKWKLEIIDIQEGTVGGFKEIIFNVNGEGVYGQLKYESGVHRVQRVPKTETQGRLHTSAASVVVLPEADEFDIEKSFCTDFYDWFQTRLPETNNYYNDNCNPSEPLIINIDEIQECPEEKECLQEKVCPPCAKKSASAPINKRAIQKRNLLFFRPWWSIS